MKPQQLEDRLIGFAVMSLGKWLGLLGSRMQPLLGLRCGMMGVVRMALAPCSVNLPARHRQVFFCQRERFFAGELCFRDRAPNEFLFHEQTPNISQSMLPKSGKIISLSLIFRRSLPYPGKS